MTPRRFAQVAVGALILGWLAIFAVACHGCIHPTPPPTPAGCAAACAHLQALGCSTSPSLCERLCERAAPNQPTYPACVANATSCAAADGCQ